MNLCRQFLCCAVVLVGVLLCSGAPAAGKNNVTIRGHQQEIYFYPGKGNGTHLKLLFAPGDGGWHGFAETIAETLAASGYDVYGLDTRVYLEGFTGQVVLTPSQIAADFAQIAQWMTQYRRERVLLMGWSEGAGLCLAAAAETANHNMFMGLAVIGMTEYNTLAWRWKDLTATFRGKLPNEPVFRSQDYLAKVSPLPLFAITATHDEYVSPATTSALFAAARDPKRLVMLDARNHKFAGNTEEFFRKLMEGLAWIQQQRH